MPIHDLKRMQQRKACRARLRMGVKAAAALLLACPMAMAQARSPNFSVDSDQPMTFTLGRLPDSKACGLDCVDFIVADGEIGLSSSFSYLIAHTRLGERRVPILLDSPGGVRGGMELLMRMWRKFGVTIVVARARARPCGEKRAPACDPADAAHGVKIFDVAGDKAQCASACPFALMGGVKRIVPPRAKIGVHAPHLDTSEGLGRVLAGIDPNIETGADEEDRVDFAAMAKEMGVSPALADRAMKTPHHTMDWLSGADVNAYGLATVSLAKSGLPPRLIAALSRRNR